MVSEGGNNNHSSKMSFRISKDDRFFSRLLAKENSTPNSSSRILYYGETSVAVPFTWEAQPGTPKHPLSRTSLPPLTPPPSYFSSPKSHTANKRNSKPNNYTFLTILPRLLVSSRTKKSQSHNLNVSVSPSSSLCLAYYSSSTRHTDPGPPSYFSLSPFKLNCCTGFRDC